MTQFDVPPSVIGVPEFAETVIGHIAKTVSAYKLDSTIAATIKRGFLEFFIFSFDQKLSSFLGMKDQDRLFAGCITSEIDQ